VKKSIQHKLSIFLILFTLVSYSQKAFIKPDTFKINKNEIGIDVANIITFLKKNPQSYLINYKYYFTPKSAFRGALDLDWSSLISLGKYLDTRLGFEFNKQNDNWRLFYGTDFSFSFSKNNLQTIKTYKLGLEPLIGVKYFINKHFSISTEAKLNFYNYFYRDPFSFDTNSNSQNYRIVLGSVGMVILNYYF
jgi:hypothetical protein